MVVDTGDLNKRISIAPKKMVKSTGGIQTKSFDTENAINTWSCINNVSDNVFWGDNNENNTSIMNFTIRYRKNISQQMLVKYKNNYYEIVDIDDYMEQHIFITLRTKLVILK